MFHSMFISEIQQLKGGYMHQDRKGMISLPAGIFQYSLNMEFIRQKWHWCCDWRRATLESPVQNKPLFAPLAVRVPLFHFTLQQNR